MNLFELFVKIGAKDEASGTISKITSGLGKGLATAAKIGTAAVGAAATGIAALTKEAVNNYAEYEQLVGGVETLFSKSAKTVQGYAENAYKTAGLSANAYMETVTGFSASMIQSASQVLDEEVKKQYYNLAREHSRLSQYTDKESKAAVKAIEEEMEALEDRMYKTVKTEESIAKAAKLSDMAVTDIADNANKMGTSMESIQNAYQGFAKQNYTMLDNLKLGYGGTSQEMYRLLQDAANINKEFAKTANFSIDEKGHLKAGFADIAQAIHIIQTEMGITGTTALEAGTTIQGSVASMKSAFTNLLTGLSDGNADIEQLVDNLVTTVVGDGTETNLGVLGNVLPAVKTALNGASTLVSEALPKIMEIIPEIINDNLPVLAEAAVGVIQSLIDGISQNQESLFDTIFGVITYLAESFITMLPQIVELGLDLIVSLANGIAESLPELIPTIVDVVLKIVDTLIDNVDMLIDAAIEIILALTDGLIASLPKLIDKIPELVIKIVDAIIENAPKLLESSAEIIAKLTSGLIDGFVGISTKIGDWLYDNIVQPIIDKVSDLRDAGKQLLEGLWNGIADKVEWLKGKVSGVVDKIKSWFTGSDGFDTHSPSKWSEKVFKNVMDGGGNGLDDGLPSLLRTATGVTDDVKNALTMGDYSVPVSVAGTAYVSSQQTGGTTAELDSIRRDISFIASVLMNGITLDANDRELGRFVKKYAT